MDPSSIGANLSVIRNHVELFVVLLFGVPAVFILAIKLWVAHRATRAQRITNWFVPTDFDSESARLHYSMQHQAVALAHKSRRNARHAAPARKSNSKGSV
ncbi:MAG: hypothetical protein WCA10_16205 [Terracidiphilus sp.]